MDIDFSFQNTHMSIVVGLLADSVMLCDTLYANIGETVVLRCPCTSHDLQSQWCGPPNLTLLSFGKEIKTSLGNYDRLELCDNHDILLELIKVIIAVYQM